MKKAVADKGNEFVAYNIQYTREGVMVSPNGEYTILLPNANKLKAERILVLYIAEDGTVTEKEFTVNGEDQIAVKTTETGTYVVVEKNTSDEKDDHVTDKADGAIKDKNTNQTFVWIGVAVVILLIAAGVVVILVINKEKEQLNLNK